MKRILIKAHGIIPQNGGYIAGIGRTNIELIKRFALTQDNEIDFSIYCPTRKSIGFKHYGWEIPYHAYPFPHDALLKSNFESYYRRIFFKYDMLHITGNIDNFSAKENVVVTIHDLFLLNARNAWLFDKCIKKTNAIVTCSEFTKQDILEKYPIIEDDKITVIPWGIDHGKFFPRSEPEINLNRKKFGIKDRFFFSCSCNSPRKNIDVVLEAFSKFSDDKNDVSLVLAWGNPPSQLTDKYAREIENKKIIFIPFLDDGDLAAMYSGAIATVFVSSFEGFGFPILESMACGTPVITCRNSSLSEISANLAVYVRERNLDDLIASMKTLYEAPGLYGKNTLTTHAKRYNWDYTANQYIEFYKKAL